METIKVVARLTKSDGSHVFVYGLPYGKTKIDGITGVSREIVSFIYVGVIGDKIVPMFSTTKLSSVPLGATSLKDLQGRFWYIAVNNNEKWTKFCSRANVPVTVKSSEVAAYLFNTHGKTTHDNAAIITLCDKMRAEYLKRLTTSTANATSATSATSADNRENDLQGLDLA